MLTRQALLALVVASAGVFFGGLLLSALRFQPYRDHGWPALIISDIQSPEENPGHYVYSAAATAVSGALLLPVIASLHRQLRSRHRVLTGVGTVLLTTGACGAIAIGALSPFPVSYDDVHVPLAFLTFIAIVSGIACHAAVLTSTAAAQSRVVRTALRVCLTVQAALIPFLAYLYVVPDFFDGRTLFTTLAFLEWSLCVGILAMLLVLIAALDP